MKTTTAISEVSHEDLVDLLSTATYGSMIFGIEYDKDLYNKCKDKKEDDCIEDKAARILLNGGAITIFDRYADLEDEFYGTLPHSWDDDYKVMDYKVSLSDIRVGIAKALDNGGYGAKCAQDLINSEEGNLDLPEAEEIMQWIIFGESIYG